MWEGDFLIHATVNSTLTRTVFAESDTVIGLDYVPMLNSGIRQILEDGPIHMRLPATPPICAACREENNGSQISG